MLYAPSKFAWPFTPAAVDIWVACAWGFKICVCLRISTDASWHILWMTHTAGEGSGEAYGEAYTKFGAKKQMAVADNESLMLSNVCVMYCVQWLPGGYRLVARTGNWGMWPIASKQMKNPIREWIQDDSWRRIKRVSVGMAGCNVVECAAAPRLLLGVKVVWRCRRLLK